MITGPERRREWTDAEKIAIVAKALEPGVNVSEIARQHDLNPQQLFGWRRKFQAEAQSAFDAHRAPSFAPVMIEAPLGAVEPSSPPGSADLGSIEIKIGAALVCIRGPADAKTLAILLRALRAMA